MTQERYDIQGRLAGIPYDFRVPTWSKLRRRLYAPGGAMWVPKVFGAGWTLNLAHHASQLLLAVLATALATVTAG